MPRIFYEEEDTDPIRALRFLIEAVKIKIETKRKWNDVEKISFLTPLVSAIESLDARLNKLETNLVCTFCSSSANTSEAVTAVAQ